jgi:predicted RNase H-like HicB family nuclease
LFEFQTITSMLISSMTYGILFERAATAELPPGYFYAHLPALGLTTHGEGIEGARAAAEDLVKLWLTEKRAAGESVGLPGEFFFSTIEISESALQST